MDFRLVLTMLCVVNLGGAFGESPRELRREDLAIKRSAPENPFRKLSGVQLDFYSRALVLFSAPNQLDLAVQKCSKSM